MGLRGDQGEDGLSDGEVVVRYRCLGSDTRSDRGQCGTGTDKDWRNYDQSFALGVGVAEREDHAEDAETDARELHVLVSVSVSHDQTGNETKDAGVYSSVLLLAVKVYLPVLIVLSQNYRDQSSLPVSYRDTHDIVSVRPIGNNIYPGRLIDTAGVVRKPVEEVDQTHAHEGPVEHAAGHDWERRKFGLVHDKGGTEQDTADQKGNHRC